jgi:hypothetical protein
VLANIWVILSSQFAVGGLNAFTVSIGSHREYFVIVLKIHILRLTL